MAQKDLTLISLYFKPLLATWDGLLQRAQGWSWGLTQVLPKIKVQAPEVVFPFHWKLSQLFRIAFFFGVLFSVLFSKWNCHLPSCLHLVPCVKLVLVESQNSLVSLSLCNPYFEVMETQNPRMLELGRSSESTWSYLYLSIQEHDQLSFEDVRLGESTTCLANPYSCYSSSHLICLISVLC